MQFTFPILLQNAIDALVSNSMQNALLQARHANFDCTEPILVSYQP